MRSITKGVILAGALAVFAVVALKGAAILIPSGTWAPQTNLSSARANASAALLQDGRVLITGGDSGSGPVVTADFFAADGTISAAPPMLNARSKHVSVTLQDGRVLVAGGITAGGSATSTAEIYDPSTNSWTSVGTGMTEARSGANAALLPDGRVIIAGGQNGSSISSTIEIFDPVACSFSFAATMSSPRTQDAMAVRKDGRVIIIGGSNGTSPIASTDILDPVAGTIGTGPTLAVARFGHTATTLLNGDVVVIGGNNGNADPAQMDVTPTELFDPTTGTFTTLAANLATPREGHLAFLLPNNNSVLIAGGTSAGTAIASAELFAPAESPEGVWTYGFASIGSMSAARSSASGSANQITAPSSVMQRNGVLMVAGGMDANGSALNTTDAYGYATIQTDQSDYAPGTTVTITGSGFQPLETVTIQLVESPLIDTHGPYTVQAGANGNIFDQSFVTDSYDVNVRFYVTATGATSRLQAQNTFTDATPTNTILASSPNPSSVNQSVALTATVRNGSTQGSGTLVTTGTVDFYDQTGINNPNCTGQSGSSLGNVSVSASGTASINHPFTVAGTYKLGACYNGTSGTGTQNSQSPSVTQTVNAAIGTTTTVTASPNPSTYGQSVAFTATIAPASGSTVPTGSVQFKIDGVAFGSPVSVSSCSPSPDACAASSDNTLSAGGHTVEADFTATGIFLGSNSSTLPLTVNKADPIMSATGGTFTYDTNPHAGSGSATGVGTDGSLSPVTLSYVGVSGTTYPTTASAPVNAGSYTVTASFAGNNNYNAKDSTPAALSIAKANATVVVTPYVAVPYDGLPHTATYTITGVHSETGATVGTVTLNTTHTDAGTYASDSWSFTGAANYNDIASTTITDSIAKAPTSTNVTSSVNPSTFGQSVTFTAKVTNTATGATPTGAIVLMIDGSPVAVTVSSSGNTMTATSGATSSLSVGSHAVVAAYTNADGNFVNSTSSTLTQQVNFGFVGFGTPYAPPPTTFNVTRTMPLKWQYTNSSGAVVNSSAANPMIIINGPYACGSSDIAGTITVNDAGASGYQYDPGSNSWQFNWQIKGNAAGCYDIYVKSQQSGQTNGPFPISTVNH